MYNLIRFIEDIMLLGYAVKFEHQGKGIYTLVTIIDGDNMLSIRVASNVLRDASKLRDLKSSLIDGITYQEKLSNKTRPKSITLAKLSK